MLSNLSGKEIAVGGISIYFISELLKIIWFFIKKKSPQTTPVDKIERDYKESFYSDRNKINEMHAIITAKSNSGAPKVYNPDLNLAILKLNENIERQTELFKELKK